MIRRSWGKGKGFTLIEMVMVLVIIGILAAIIVPQFNVQMDAARQAQTQANLSTLRSGLALYYKIAGQYPADLFHLGMTIDNLPGGGTYQAVLQNPPVSDGWGRPFQYEQGTGTVRCNTTPGDMTNPCKYDW